MHEGPDLTRQSPAGAQNVAWQQWGRRQPRPVGIAPAGLEEGQALAQQDKLDRHTSNLGEWHAGRVLLPPWAPTVDGVGPDAFRKELLAFPRGARDDRVDTSSMALARLTQGQALYWSQVKLLAAQRGGRR